jgi:hypothetical protein
MMKEKNSRILSGRILTGHRPTGPRHEALILHKEALQHSLQRNPLGFI